MKIKINQYKDIPICHISFDKAIINYDEDTKDSFLDLYTKVDAGEDVQNISDSDEDLDDPEENEDSEAVNY